MSTNSRSGAKSSTEKKKDASKKADTPSSLSGRKTEMLKQLKQFYEGGNDNKETLSNSVLGDLCSEVLGGRQSIISTTSIDTKDFKDCLSHSQTSFEEEEDENDEESSGDDYVQEDEEKEEEDTISLNLAATMATISSTKTPSLLKKGEGAAVLRTSPGSGGESVLDVLKDKEENKEDDMKKKEVESETTAAAVVIIPDEEKEEKEEEDEEEKELLEQYRHFLRLLRPQLEAATGLPVEPATLEAAFSLEDARALLQQSLGLENLADLLLLEKQAAPLKLRFQPQVVVISGEEQLKSLLQLKEEETKTASQENPGEYSSSKTNFSAAEKAAEDATMTSSVVRTEKIYYFPNKLQFVTE
ncbi:hypothetical protein TYRP_006446 [Tyrophagus putrescentiae]|nr:hypothetical protein TYRP_006446 [Tyrophagus putrescentiae]